MLEMVKDRAKQTEFGEQMYCQWPQQNIFGHFENFNLKKQKLALISETVRDDHSKILKLFWTFRKFNFFN